MIINNFMNKNTKSEVEAVILLNGNYCVIPLLKSEVELFNKTLTDSIIKGFSDQTFYFNWGGYLLFAKHIIGYYFRKTPENLQSKAVNLLEKVVENMPPNTGDDSESWKNSSY
jgi:hypothetical protein